MQFNLEASGCGSFFEWLWRPLKHEDIYLNTIYVEFHSQYMTGTATATVSISRSSQVPAGLPGLEPRNRIMAVGSPGLEFRNLLVAAGSPGMDPSMEVTMLPLRLIPMSGRTSFNRRCSM